MATASVQKKATPWPLIIFAIIFGLGLVLGAIALFNPLPLEKALTHMESGYQEMLQSANQLNPLVLLTFAFVGGVLGSISPCILAMLPLNLGYIGTLNIESKVDAFRKAGAFVLGVVLITSLFGLVSGFAGAVMVQYRGYLFLMIAVIILIMAAAMLEWIHLPLPRGVARIPDAGPFVVGVAFALISSPCASPVLAGVLALAASSGSPALSVATMAAYGLGYTAIIFLASLFTGLAKQVSGLKYQGGIITRLAAGVLILAGIWTFWQGVTWFV